LDDYEIRVRFQPETSPTPTGFMADFGRAWNESAALVSQGEPLYGWTGNRTGEAWERSGMAEPLLAAGASLAPITPSHLTRRLTSSTGIDVRAGDEWMLAVVRGPWTYRVRLAAGDPERPNATVALAINDETVLEGAVRPPPSPSPPAQDPSLIPFRRPPRLSSSKARSRFWMEC
jgi:hypothetical protein